MEIDKLLKDGYVILPSVISNETCDKLKNVYFSIISVVVTKIRFKF